MLEVRDLDAGYGRVRVLRGVSLTVPAGKIVALLGANGAGKTTLLRAICGLASIQSGTITFAGGDGDRAARPKPWCGTDWCWFRRGASCSAT